MNYLSAIRFMILALCMPINLHSVDSLSPEDVEEGYQAILECDYLTAIKIALPLAENGEPEAQFTVGFVSLLWLDSDCSDDTPIYDQQEAMVWIKQAACQGVVQAAELIENAYKFGKHGLPENTALASCWASVSNEERLPSECKMLENDMLINDTQD